MQKIDQEKLSEFTNELSVFQTEASKTASIDVYDRFTISKLEDHVVDLFQLSVDASHIGLQYLCERLRDNIRDHFITGTNISNEEFALMAEWKSLVKVYLVDNDNLNIVSALAANLSKPGWTYPLSSDEASNVTSILLGKSSNNKQNLELDNDALSDEEVSEFDAYMAESSTSLADVFESFSDEDGEEESDVSFINEKETSIAEFFEGNDNSKPATKFDEQPSSQEISNFQVESTDPANNDLPEIDETVTETLANDMFADGDVHQDLEVDEDLDQDMLEAEAAFTANANSSIDKVEVSSQELEDIDQSVSNSIVADNGMDESEHSDDFDKELPSAEASFTADVESSVDKVEVSSQELEEIDQSVSNSITDELFVADDSVDESEYNEDFDKELSSTEAAFTADAGPSVDKVEVSSQELEEIDQSVSNSIVDELFVADDGVDESEHSEDFDEELSSAEAAFSADAESSVDKVEVSSQELEEIDQSVSNSVADDGMDVSDHGEDFDKELSSTEAAFTDDAESSVDKVEVSSQELEEIDQSVSNSVADDGMDVSDHGEDFDKELSSTEAAFTDDAESSVDKVEVSSQELEEINQSVANSIADELFVADDGVDESEHSEDFDKELSSTEAVFSTDAESSVDKVEVSSQEPEEIDQSVANSIADELFVADDDVNKSDDSEDYGKELLNAEAVFPVDDSPSDYLGTSTQELECIDKASSKSIADELYEAVDGNDQSVEDESLEAMPASETASHEVVETVADELFVDDNEVVLESDDSPASSPIEEPETVYMEPVEKKPAAAPRSIIEAYVGVISDKIHRNKPKELEQELIKQPPKPAPIQTLEPVDSILLKYPDWSEEQKELLSLILSEVHDVVDQQDEVLNVLHKDDVVEQEVLDMVSLYSEQIERMGSAAEMVGLDALQKLCELIGFHFGDLEKSSTEMIVDSEKRIRQWPFIIYDYLKNIDNERSHQDAINYISDDAWARTIREDIKSDLKEAFSHSTIYVDSTEEDQRITNASPQDVDITVSDDVQAELLDGLLQELPHQAEEFSEAIQQLIKDDYLNQLEVTQRIAHTIKGAANTVGIVGVATLTHHLEDILQALLKAKAKPSSNLHMALLDASDCLEQMTECLLGQGDLPDDAVQTMQVILDWANYIDEFGVPKDDADQSVSSANIEQSKNEEKTAVKEEKDSKVKSTQDASLRVPANMIDELINQSGESIIATSQMHENVNKLLTSMRDIKKNKDNVYSLSQQLEHLIDVQGTDDKFSSGNKNEKFDPLELDQYNELHTYSRRLIEATADSVELIKDLEDRLFSLESVIVDQTRAQKDNQYAILKTRMMPVESVVPRLKRGVRQAAKISGKSVELEVSGVDTLFDSKILNNLIDPLMHLLRNAVDHGIESNEVREANGKSLPGIIKLSFAQVGERLEIHCQDDGKGLDAEAIKARAIDKGMILNDQELSDDEIHQIIMQHGFSTRDEVTQLSGRGVGMDVVYSNIKDLNGSVVISSVLNQGMNVELSLPVSLLTAHALLIPTVSGSMAVSAGGIEEILQVNLDNLNETEQGLVLQVEDNEYPAVHLEQLLQMRLTISSNKRQSYTALLVEEFGGQKKVVLLNEIQSVRDIIIKPISHYLPKVIGLVGATVLGNGDIAPVVDVVDLLSQQSNVIGKLNVGYSTDLEEIHQSSVLVVEDSISTRRSLAEFMQDLNYKVYTAKDGVEAIEIMRDHSPTLLLTDLEMPRMNGLELTSYVRSHDETKDIPIIMLTSRSTEKHRQEAKSIGVNEYLSKPFVEDILLEKVQSLVISK